MDWRSLEHWRRAAYQPEVLVRRDGVRRWQISGNLGRVPRARQKAQGPGPSVWSVARPHFRRPGGVLVSLSLVMGRPGGRGGRQDRLAQQQGDGGVGQVRRRLLERLL